MQREEAGQASWLPDRTGQETSCCVRKEDKNDRGYIGVYIELSRIVTVSNNRGFMEPDRKISKTGQGSCMSGLGVWVRVTINKLRIPDAKGWPYY